MLRNFFFDTTFLLVISWLIPVVMLFIVPRNRKPSSANAWLLLCVLIPYAGLLVFLVLGSPKLSARRRAQQHTANELIREVVNRNKGKPEGSLFAPNLEPRYEPIAQLAANLGELPALAGNNVHLLPNYHEAIQCIADDIDQAQSFVHIEYFALSRDEETEVVFAAMERAQKRGVKVRVLFDQIGSRKYPNFKKMLAWFQEVNIEYHPMLPFSVKRGHYNRLDLRNHRKIVVIDGHTGFMGSQNMIKRNYFRKDAIYYDELVAELSGPVVAELHAIFLTDWYSESGVLLNAHKNSELQFTPQKQGEMFCQVIPSGSGFDNYNNLKVFISLFYAARTRLVVTNPYFVPDEGLLMAITSAALRGVEVILINSEASDQFLVSNAQRSYYEELLKAGVRIYWYTAPTLLHSKHVTIDDDIAVIGSSNMDMRSFQLNMEATLLCYGPQVVRDLRLVEEMYLNKSKPVTLQTWMKRPLRAILAENISRLTAALQ